MKQRNRLVGALTERLTNARRTVRFVFRSEPETVRKVSSDYFRNMKRKSRNKAQAVTGTEDTMEVKTPAEEAG